MLYSRPVNPFASTGQMTELGNVPHSKGRSFNDDSLDSLVAEKGNKIRSSKSEQSTSHNERQRSKVGVGLDSLERHLDQREGTKRLPKSTVSKKNIDDDDLSLASDESDEYTKSSRKLKWNKNHKKSKAKEQTEIEIPVIPLTNDNFEKRLEVELRASATMSKRVASEFLRVSKQRILPFAEIVEIENAEPVTTSTEGVESPPRVHSPKATIQEKSRGPRRRKEVQMSAQLEPVSEPVESAVPVRRDDFAQRIEQELRVTASMSKKDTGDFIRTSKERAPLPSDVEPADEITSDLRTVSPEPADYQAMSRGPRRRRTVRQSVSERLRSSDGRAFIEALEASRTAKQSAPEPGEEFASAEAAGTRRVSKAENQENSRGPRRNRLNQRVSEKESALNESDPIEEGKPPHRDTCQKRLIGRANTRITMQDSPKDSDGKSIDPEAERNGGGDEGRSGCAGPEASTKAVVLDTQVVPLFTNFEQRLEEELRVAASMSSTQAADFIRTSKQRLPPPSEATGTAETEADSLATPSESEDSRIWKQKHANREPVQSKTPEPVEMAVPVFVDDFAQRIDEELRAVAKMSKQQAADFVRASKQRLPKNAVEEDSGNGSLSSGNAFWELTKERGISIEADMAEPNPGIADKQPEPLVDNIGQPAAVEEPLVGLRQMILERRKTAKKATRNYLAVEAEKMSPVAGLSKREVADAIKGRSLPYSGEDAPAPSSDMLEQVEEERVAVVVPARPTREQLLQKHLEDLDRLSKSQIAMAELANRRLPSPRLPTQGLLSFKYDDFERLIEKKLQMSASLSTKEELAAFVRNGSRLPQSTEPISEEWAEREKQQQFQEELETLDAILAQSAALLVGCEELDIVANEASTGDHPPPSPLQQPSHSIGVARASEVSGSAAGSLAKKTISGLVSKAFSGFSVFRLMQGGAGKPT